MNRMMIFAITISTTVWSIPTSLTSSTTSPTMLPTMSSSAPIRSNSVSFDPLDLNPIDIQQSRQLHQSHPSLPAHELARLIPITPIQRDLITWMSEDLIRYRKDHSHVWEHRKKPRPDPFHAALAAETLSDAAARLDQLTLRDFHRLASVFACPDKDDDQNKDRISRFAMDITVENGDRFWHQNWPRESFVFTNKTLSYKRMAMSYGTRTHYVGLLSHMDERFTPGEFLLHDLNHSKGTAERIGDRDIDWAAIHAAYRRWQQGRSRSQRRLDDVAYFFMTHELLDHADPFRLCLMMKTNLDYYNMGVLGNTVRTIDFDREQLEASVYAVREFWLENVLSGYGSRNPIKRQ